MQSGERPLALLPLQLSIQLQEFVAIKLKEPSSMPVFRAIRPIIFILFLLRFSLLFIFNVHLLILPEEFV